MLVSHIHSLYLRRRERELDATYRFPCVLGGKLCVYYSPAVIAMAAKIEIYRVEEEERRDEAGEESSDLFC